MRSSWRLISSSSTVNSSGSSASNLVLSLNLRYSPKVVSSDLILNSRLELISCVSWSNSFVVVSYVVSWVIVSFCLFMILLPRSNCSSYSLMLALSTIVPWRERVVSSRYSLFRIGGFSWWKVSSDSSSLTLPSNCWRWVFFSLSWLSMRSVLNSMFFASTFTNRI